MKRKTKLRPRIRINTGAPVLYKKKANFVTPSQVTTKIKKAINNTIEKKYIDFNNGVGSIPVDTNGIALAPQLPIQGVGNNERVGETINVTSYQFKFLLYGDIGVPLQPTIFRIVFFQYFDNSFNSAIVQDDALIPHLPNNYLLSLYDLEGKQSFKILYDKYFTCGTTIETRIRHVHVSLTKLSRKMQLVQPTRLQDNCVKNEIRGYIFSNAPVGAVSFPSFVWNGRMNYTDA